MKLNTASSAISFSKKLEEDSLRLYEQLAPEYPEGRETFLSLAEENRRNEKAVARAYYGVISDALEGGFSFDNMETDDFSYETGLPQDASYLVVLDMVIAMEEKIMAFYSTAAEASKSLLADVPRAFERIARRRGERIEKLRALVRT
jgi:rubrerythrin